MRELENKQTVLGLIILRYCEMLYLLLTWIIPIFSKLLQECQEINRKRLARLLRIYTLAAFTICINGDSLPLYVTALKLERVDFYVWHTLYEVLSRSLDLLRFR